MDEKSDKEWMLQDDESIADETEIKEDVDNTKYCARREFEVEQDQKDGIEIESLCEIDENKVVVVNEAYRSKNMDTSY